MFVYWKGYEIDGSSTTYNIVVPQRELVVELLRYFLNLKIIDRDAAISLDYSEIRNSKNKKESYKLDDIDKICEVLERPDIQWFSLSTSCIHPEKMYPEVRKNVYSLSKTRPGAEDRIYNYRNPTVSPLYIGPDLYITLEVSFSEGKRVEDYKPEGLIFNNESLINNMKGSHLTIDFECGPSFIYEYAAYITSKIAERFPEIGIDGGIDCAGGFIDGCTYSWSLYCYEKLTLETLDIADAIRHIIKEGIVTPQKRGGAFGNRIVPCSNLFLFNLYKIDKTRDTNIEPKTKIIKGIVADKRECTPEEYEHIVQKASKVDIFDSIDFMHYCTCCVKIDDNICALTCTKKDGRMWLELLVEPEIRDDVEKRLRACGLSIK